MPEESVIGVSIEDMEPTPPEKAPDAEPQKPDFGAQTAALEAALRISEEARQRAEAALRSAPSSQPAPPVKEEQDALELLTDEDLARLAEDKGVVAAIRAAQAQTFKLAERGLNTRLSGLQSSGVSFAEQSARTKYALEFELFGDQISELINQAPDKSVLANPATWDNMIAWVRGKDGNVQKYAERLASGSREKAEANARAMQRDNAGAHPTVAAGPTGSSPSAGDDGFYGLDPTEREIADKLGRSYRDYAHWKKVGA